MEQWLHALPNFMRVILDAPPGAEQKKALAAVLQKDVSSQGVARLRQTIGSYSEHFARFMKEGPVAALTGEAAAHQVGFTDDELQTILGVLKNSDEQQWTQQKQQSLAGKDLPRGTERLAARNPHWEQVYLEKTRDEDGVLHRDFDQVAGPLKDVQKELDAIMTRLKEKAAPLATLYSLVSKYVATIGERFKKKPQQAKQANAECESYLDLIVAESSKLGESKTLDPEQESAQRDILFAKASATEIWWG